MKQSDTFLLLNCTIYYTLFQSTIIVVGEVIYTILVQYVKWDEGLIAIKTKIKDENFKWL